MPKNGIRYACLTIMSFDKSNLQAIVASLSEYCHILGQPSTIILSSIELLRIPDISSDVRNMALDSCYEATLEIKKILAEMKRTCAEAETKSE